MRNRYPNIYAPARGPRWVALVAAVLALLLAYLAGPRARGAEPPAGGTRVPLPLAVAEPPASVMRFTHGSSGCSATCIASENGRSLVLCAAHCFGGAPSASFRQKARLTLLSDGSAYDGVGVAGSERADCALIVVEATLPAAPVNPQMPPVGAEVEHFGITSRHAVGRIVDNPDLVNPEPTQLFRSTMASIPGDSGAAIFHRGSVVAWNWGYYGGSPRIQAGTPIRFALAAAVASEEVRRLFPETVKAWAALKPPPVQPPPPPVKPPVIEPPPPPPSCPPPQDRRGPIRRFLFPRR